MKLSRLIKWSIPVVLVIAGVFFLKRKSAPVAETSNIGVVEKRDLIQSVTISGQIFPKRRADVKPSFAGYIEKIFVKVGQKVQKGDALVTFSPSAGRGETNFPVRAAFAGTVTQILRSEGEFTSETSGDQNVVLRVDDLSERYVLASVPELDIAKIKVGLPANIKISALNDATFKGKIEEISLSSKDKEKWGSTTNPEFQIRVSFDSNDPRVYGGMSALLDVIGARADGVLTLSHEYVQPKDKGYVVTLESGEERAVEVGLQTDESVEIKSGLKEGDRVRPIDFLALPPLAD